MRQTVGKVMTPSPLAVPGITPVAQVAEVMRDQGIGGVLVIDGGRLRGLVTDRDIVVRVVAAGRDAATTAVADICSEKLVTVTPDQDTATVVRLMREHALRRIPVVDDDDGQPVGMVTLSDIAFESDPRSALA